VADVIQGIHARSPKARVLFVNYAAILPDSGRGCWPQMPITEGDVGGMMGTSDLLVAALRR
jgi:hypothetical protein